MLRAGVEARPRSDVCTVAHPTRANDVAVGRQKRGNSLTVSAAVRGDQPSAISNDRAMNSRLPKYHSAVRIPLPRAALIDLDGTIIDSLEGAKETWTAVCDEAAGRLDVAADALYRAIEARRLAYWNDPRLAPVGRMDLRAATRQFVVQAFRDLGIDGVDEARRVADGFRDLRDRFHLVEGALDTLKALCTAGVRLALVTNGAGPIQRAKVAEFGLAQFFEHILIEGELGFGKPDERVYLHALSCLGAAPAETWMVGDDLEWEVAAPQKLGIYTVWVQGSAMGTPTAGREGVRPDRIIGSLAELLREG